MREDVRSAALRLPLAAWEAEVTVPWHALPVGRRPSEGRLALLLRAPLRPRRVHIAPGTTGKTHEAPAVHLHAQAALVVGAVEGHNARST